METTQEPKKPRKRNSSDWERNKQKALRMQGKEYKGMTKIDGHYKFTVERPEKSDERKKVLKKMPELFFDRRGRKKKHF